MRAVLQSLVYVVPRANSAGTSCIRVIFTSSDTSRSGQGRRSRPAAAGRGESRTDRECKQNERRAGLTALESESVLGERVVRGQAGDERDATANRPRQKFQLSLYLFPRSPFGAFLKNKL